LVGCKNVFFMELTGFVQKQIARLLMLTIC
jgi:hypothetical protein